MNLIRHVIAATRIWPVICLLVLTGLLHQQPAWGAGPPGLSIKLYLRPDGADGNVPLGAPIKVLMVVKNESGAELITERDFAQKEFYFSLVLIYTDQFDKVQVFTLADEELHTMMTAFYVAGRPMVPASTLPSTWAKSITIEDIGELFPILKTKPGSYILKAELPFLRFQWGFKLVPIGQLGAADHPDNFSGILVANEIPINVSPDKGAQVEVRVIDNANLSASPIPQLPVKIFKKSDIPAGYSLEDIFTTLDPVLAGTTNFDGQADWYSGSRCLVNDDYTIIADNNGDYGEASIARDTEAGWQVACTGLIEKEILFGPKPPEDVNDLVTISYGRVLYNRRTGDFSYTATIVNNSDINLTGPVWVAIQNLVPTGAVIKNADGVVNGNPYIEALGQGIAFNSGDAIIKSLIINNPSRYRISFDSQVLAVKPSP